MPKRKPTKKKSDIKTCMRQPRVCRHCGAVEMLKTYRSIKNGVVRIAWARCSECNRVTREQTVCA